MIRRLTTAMLVAALALPVAAHAQNREHQQLAADFQLLQEQVRLIQLAINELAKRVDSTNDRIDQQAEATRSGFAGQQTVIDSLEDTLTTLREKLNDNTVRVGQLMQEMDTIRQGIEMLQTLLNQIIVQLAALPVAAATEDDPERGSDDPSAPAGGSESPPPPAGLLGLDALDTSVLPPSPSAAYQYAFGQLYSNGDHALAIEAFRDFLTNFPTAADAPNAQFFMGESMYHLGQYRDAIQAYGALIAIYPDSDRVPDAYFKQGVCYQSLRQNDDARRIYRLIEVKFPDSTAAVNAKTRLKDIGGGGVSR